MPEQPRSQAAGAPQPFWDVPGMHSVSFQRNRLDGRFRAMCTCGWARSGPGADEDAIRTAAAVHDTEWVDALNAERVPS